MHPDTSTSESTDSGGATPSLVGGLSVWRTGTGPSLVLLHANGGDHRDYDAVVPDLAAAGWSVTIVDWPGHGDSPRHGVASAVGFAERLIEMLGDLGGGPHVLVGNSVGGFAAVRAAARRPDLVAGLVLVSPGGFTPQWLGTATACRVVGSGPVAPRAFRLLPRLYLRGRNEWVHAVLDRTAAASRTPERVAVYAEVWRSFADRDHDARPDAAAVRCPTLLVWGTRDPILPWRIDGRRAVAALPDATTITFPGAGHQPFVERPGEFLDRVGAFLSERRAGLAP